MNFAQNGRIILTDLEPTPTGGNQWIRWQRCDGALNYTNANTRWRPRTAGRHRDHQRHRNLRVDRTTPNTCTPSSPAATPTFASMGTAPTRSRRSRAAR